MPANDQQLPALIFDFDGTLVDSLRLFLDVLYRQVHNRPLPVEDISQLRSMTMLQLLRQLRVSPWRALLARKKVNVAMGERLSEVGLVPGVSEMLRELSRQYQLYILSSNDRANISAILERFGLGVCISGVQGGANPLNKAHALHRLLRKHHLRTAWYIGDQAGDVKAAHRVGLKAAAVSWGFSNLHALELVHPDLLVFTPIELEQYFRQGAGNE